METTSVTSKGQVTIPKPLRQQLGLRQGSKVEFVLVGDHAEMRIVSTPADLPASGFGMLKSKRAAVPANFDPAGLLARRQTGRSKGSVSIPMFWRVITSGTRVTPRR